MESIASYLPWIQIVLSVLLILGVIFQQSGAGLGSAFGGGDSATYHTKRGFEKFLFYFTIVVSVLFVASTILAILVK